MRPPVLPIGALGGSQNNYTGKENTDIQNQTGQASPRVFSDSRILKGVKFHLLK